MAIGTQATRGVGLGPSARGCGLCARGNRAWVPVTWLLKRMQAACSSESLREFLLGDRQAKLAARRKGVVGFHRRFAATIAPTAAQANATPVVFGHCARQVPEHPGSRQPFRSPRAPLRRAVSGCIGNGTHGARHRSWSCHRGVFDTLDLRSTTDHAESGTDRRFHPLIATLVCW